MRNLRSAILLLLASFTSPAFAQDHPAMMDLRHDTIELTSESTDRATLHFYNNAETSSRTGTYTLQIGNIIVDVIITLHVNAEGAERITAKPRENFVAVPRELDVIDGQTGEILIVLPMF